ncbi:MAG: hypothetical protein ACI4HQ_10230 [Acetatifactor sp.]
MPRLQPTARDRLKIEVESRWNFAMNMARLSWKQMAKIMGVCDATYFNRHKNIEKMTLEEIWSIERATGCKLTMPFQRKDEQEGG